jgi:hypothetical protein
MANSGEKKVGIPLELTQQLGIGIHLDTAAVYQLGLEAGAANAM